MATLASLKKQIAALEAQVERVTKVEMSAALSKIKKLMADYGVTVEHLLGGAKNAVAKKAAGKKTAAKSKGVKPARYADPHTGATWSGLGRIPGWIATAKNRDDFLIDHAAASSVDATQKTAPKKAATKRAAKKAAATPRKTVAVKSAAKPAAKKRAARKTTRTRAASMAQEGAESPAET